MYPELLLKLAAALTSLTTGGVNALHCPVTFSNITGEGKKGGGKKKISVSVERFSIEIRDFL